MAEHKPEAAERRRGGGGSGGGGGGGGKGGVLQSPGKYVKSATVAGQAVYRQHPGISALLASQAIHIQRPVLFFIKLLHQVCSL